ncbi:helix-turn-helix transcriptional regulator [Puniceibacterium sp. HSS470]|nr:helix-turn-helix transcriptional regulator [Puniceibacterium sp. HSS470]|tara:strand:+ start:28745 stop:29443 length:699 start_codon:yes stop_codon:yes gene_type:complete
MDPILAAIDVALKRKGLSDAAASKMAVGHASLIKNLRMPRSGEKRYNLPALQKLAEVLDLELYFGPKRDTGPVQQIVIEGDDYAHIPVHAATLAAGNGALNTEESVVDHLAFKREWLRRIGVTASAAVLARVANGDLGESMMPTICPGDMVLIDTSRREIPNRPADYKSRKGPIYAFTTDEGARVKRVAQMSDMVILISDNPDIGPEFLTRDKWASFNVIGKVVWWGHTAEE